MKNFLFFCILGMMFFSFSSLYDEDTQVIKLQILVNGQLWNEGMAIDSSAIITLELTDKEPGIQYNFEEISVKWVLERQRVGRNYKKRLSRKLFGFFGSPREFEVTLMEREVTQEGLAECYDCGKYNLSDQIGNYQGYSENPKVIFAYDKFYDPCLSRIIIKIEKISTKNKTGEVGLVENFEYKDDYSLTPKWSRCKDVDYAYYFWD